MFIVADDVMCEQTMTIITTTNNTLSRHVAAGSSSSVRKHEKAWVTIM